MTKTDTVVIAAAGKGTRMLHLVKNKPKHLIKVVGKPFLSYLLQNLQKAGLKKIILVIGHKKQAFNEFFQNHDFEFDITLIDQFEKTDASKYGSAMPILAAKKELGEKQFLAVYGDNLYSPEDIRRFRINDEFQYLGAIKHQNPEKYGCLEKDKDGFLTRIIEKPKNPKSNLINTGIYKFTPEIFKSLENITVSPRGEYELTDAVELLARKNKVKVIELNGYWLDFGSPTDIINASEIIKNNHD